MAIGQIGNAGSRVVLLISAAVVLGLAVWLADWWNTFDTECKAIPNKQDRNLCLSIVGRWPSSTEYAAFTGAFGLLDALVGFIPTFTGHGLVWTATLALDALTAIFYLAGGVNLAVLYSANGGGPHACDGSGSDKSTCDTLTTRIEADIAFMFIGFIFALVALVFMFFLRRSNK